MSVEVFIIIFFLISRRTCNKIKMISDCRVIIHLLLGGFQIKTKKKIEQKQRIVQYLLAFNIERENQRAHDNS